MKRPAMCSMGSFLVVYFNVCMWCGAIYSRCIATRYKEELERRQKATAISVVGNRRTIRRLDNDLAEIKLAREVTPIDANLVLLSLLLLLLLLLLALLCLECQLTLFVPI